MTAPLAEVIEEGRYVLAKWAPAEIPLREAMGVPVRVAVLERLLAVAEAALEMREATKFYFGRHSIESDADGGSVRLANAASAFDAAARGEK